MGNKIELEHICDSQNSLLNRQPAKTPDRIIVEALVGVRVDLLWKDKMKHKKHTEEDSSYRNTSCEKQDQTITCDCYHDGHPHNDSTTNEPKNKLLLCKSIVLIQINWIIYFQRAELGAVGL